MSNNTGASVKYFSGQLTDKFETRDGKRLDDSIFSADQESLLPTKKWIVVSGQSIEVPGSIIGRVEINSPVTLAVEVGEGSVWKRVIDMFVGIRQNSGSIAEYHRGLVEEQRRMAEERRAKEETRRLRYEREQEAATARDTDQVLSLLEEWGLSCHPVQQPFLNSIFTQSLISPKRYGWIEIEHSSIQYLRVLAQDCIQYWIPDPRMEPEDIHVEVWNSSYRTWSTGMDTNGAYDLGRENCIFVNDTNKSIDVAKSESLAAALEKNAEFKRFGGVIELQNHPVAGYWLINRYRQGTYSHWEGYEKLAIELLSLDLSDLYIPDKHDSGQVHAMTAQQSLAGRILCKFGLHDGAKWERSLYTICTDVGVCIRCRRGTSRDSHKWENGPAYGGYDSKCTVCGKESP